MQRDLVVKQAVLPLFILALVLVALYLPGLHGPFLFDDYSNLLLNPAIRALRDGQMSWIEVLRAGHAGPLGRPISVLSLAWQGSSGVPVPFPFKLFNLTIHILNALLVYWLAHGLLAQHVDRDCRDRQSAGFDCWALAAALLWAVHPLVLTPVLYVVQRMTSLSALGVLLGLNAAVIGYERLRTGRAAGVWLWLAVPCAGVFALLSKESGVLLMPFLAVLASTLLRTDHLPPLAQRAWQRWQWGAWRLPAMFALMTLPWTVPVVLHGFQDRDFTLFERLLTESRVLWMYLRFAVLPNLALMGLYHDDLPLSTDWWTPASTLPAVLGLVACTLAAAALARRLPWLAFGWFFFLASQLLESTLVPLELMHEHRMYLGLLGIVLPLVAGIRWVIAYEVKHGKAAGLLAQLHHRRLDAMLLLPLVLSLALVTSERVFGWSAALNMAVLEAKHHPRSIQAIYEVATLYGKLAELSPDPAERERLFKLAEKAALDSLALGPREVQPRIGLLIVRSESGQTVSAEEFSSLQQGLRDSRRADLLVDNLITLIECNRIGACHFEPADLLACADALAANARLAPNAIEEVALLRDEIRAMAAADAKS